MLMAISLNACSLFTPSASVNQILAEPQRYADDERLASANMERGCIDFRSV
jgi:hypothetical protein